MFNNPLFTVRKQLARKLSVLVLHFFPRSIPLRLPVRDPPACALSVYILRRVDEARETTAPPAETRVCSPLIARPQQLQLGLSHCVVQLLQLRRQRSLASVSGLVVDS